MLETLAAVSSATVAAFALLFTWTEVRLKSLRADDVLRWANDSIAALNSLYLLLYISRHKKSPSIDFDTRTEEIIFLTSNLVEQGRLLFKNAHPDKYGTEKKPAYRGLRPLILDYLVVAHQIACVWRNSDDKKRAALEVLADECVKSFVSLAQGEVGRKGAISKDAVSGGNGSHLAERLKRITPQQIASLRP